MITADIIVAGAGHNSLVTACYLASAGYSCAILDARAVPGGGATTEEILGPGYAIDTCSTGHTLIQQNPLIRLDELGLVAKHGLSYIDPDPVAHVALPDGEQITMFLDPEKTIREYARFSEQDAESYRTLLTEFAELRPMLAEARSKPIGHGKSLAEILAAHPRGGIWSRRMAMSANDVICHEFKNRHIRAFMGWMAFQTAVPIDQAGTGLLAYQIIAPRQARSWSIPRGGSGRLIDALVGYLRDHGAEFHCDTQVNELILDGERCVGVRADDGREFRARKAVVSTIHVKHLAQMAPKSAWGESFVFGAETYNVGVPFFASYIATMAPPVFKTARGDVTAVSAGYAGWLEDLVQSGRDIYDGVMSKNIQWMLAATPSLADAGRAPEGHHTVKLLTHTIYDLPGTGPAGWEGLKEQFADRLVEIVQRFCPGFTDDVILSRLTKSPVDIEVANQHMIHGAPHGGDRSYTFSGPQRPVPGWAAHKMPIPGLYQTGGTTHPGGSITGIPGRNAAMVVLGDLGETVSDFMEL
ncbi:NAD(P)/FAD-dependent oxidoreductase [uncultured Boseongicola sp.]|uniref:phytoene desaturase family protein n=1 Tax=uncultured Boseongicola sp. TaxID=1648499 RepID=UPI0026025D3F|nr:NAD(P)/FAD-dependent oxidoreductase [uncultured Boseongicola sp.]